MTVDSCHKVTLVGSYRGTWLLNSSSMQSHTNIISALWLLSLSKVFQFSITSVCPFILHHCFTLHVEFLPLLSGVLSRILYLYYSPRETFLKKKTTIKEKRSKRRKKRGKKIPDISHRCKRICCSFVSHLSAVDLKLRPDWVKHVSSW